MTSVITEMYPNRITNSSNTYHHIVNFENGYAVSIIRNPFSYGGSSGLFEIGLLAGVGEDAELIDHKKWGDQVCGWLNDDQVLDELLKIKNAAFGDLHDETPSSSL